MLRIFKWFDENLLAVLAGFLLVFIPLYPKWPLFDAIPGYVVRVRLEDFLVALTLAVYAVQLLRRKISFVWSPVTVGLVTYLVSGLLSVVVSVFVINTVPLEYLHAGKTFLHWLRRLEYFSLFFVVFGAIRSGRTAKIYLVLFFVTLLAVTIYGYGQKYLYWPAFSTMNREFSKGWWLYLTEHARVLSTFGGHYDLAGYLVIALTLAWSFFFGVKKILHKILVGLVLAGGFWLLILTASRISFGAYLLGLTVVIFLWTFKKGLGWGISRWVVATFFSILLMLSFGEMSDRFLRLIRIADRVGGLRQVLLKPTAAPPRQNAMFLENNLAAVALRSDVPPTPIKPGDVTGKEAPLLIPTETATGTALVPTQRTYSRYALLFDLSTGIRLDATWPRAIAGFLRNPITGSGYATLTKTTREEFTEAESTDNSFLRALGETGFLGTASFFGTIGAMGWLAFKSLGGIKDSFLYSLTAAFIGLVAGLFFNALLIDIFEASKVAYVFWGVAGLTMGSLYLEGRRIKRDYEPLKIEFSWGEFMERIKRIVHSDIFWVAFLAVFAFWLRTYKLNTPLADWHSWRQADTSAVTRNFLKNDRINWLYPTYDDLSSVPSGKPNPNGYRFVEFPIYNAATVLVRKVAVELSVEEAGRVTTALASVAAMIFIFLLCRRMISRRVAYLTAFVYSFLPYSIYYGRVILPEPSMVAASLGAIWFACQYGEKARLRYFVISVILAAAAILIKPFAVFLLAPILYIWLASYGFSKKTIFLFSVFCFLFSVPFLLWRFWMQQFPEGIPANTWLLNGDGIRFKGAFWYWLFADRIGRLILGYWGLVLLGFGLVRKAEGKYRFFPIFFLLSSFLYLFVFATGNVRHDYYQILLLPAMSIFVGLGLDYLLATSSLIPKFLAAVSVSFMLAFGWYFVRDYYNINHPEIVEAGRQVEKLTHDKALVVAPYDGDTAFLYQTNRKGWPIMDGSIEDLIKKGAHYYVSVRFDETTKNIPAQVESWELARKMEKEKLARFNLLRQTESFVIVQLVPDDKLPK